MSVYCFFGALLLMYLIEPFLLHHFGTTPGKLIFGLHITMTHGVKLSYYAARQRTKTLLWRGFAWGIPILSLVRLWNCRKLCIAGQEQDWDEYPLARTYTIRDVKPWRNAVFIAAVIGMLCVCQWAMDASALPPNRGDLTVAEFAENYNFICRYYYGQPAHYQLDINGKWNPKPGSVWDIDALEALEHRGFIRPTINNAGELNWSTQLFNLDQIYISPVYGGPPPLEYRVDRSGNIIGISLSDETIYIRNAAYCDDYRLLALAYIQAQPEARPLTGTAWYIGRHLDHLYENAEFSLAGVTVHCNIEPLEGDTYAYAFRMVKEP